MWKVVFGGLVVCWFLLGTLGDAMSDRDFLLALGLTVSVSTYVAVRGPAWYSAYRIGRLVDRELRVAMAEETARQVVRQRHAR